MKTMAMCVMGVWALVLGGCTVPTVGTGTAKDAPAADGAATTGGGTSCAEIVQCTDPCSAGDDACIDACIAKGAPSAQTAAKALKSCIETNGCADDTCLKAKCSAQVNACMQAPAGATPPAAASGSVPSDLVGTWQHNGEELLAIQANGALHRQSDVWTGSCQSTGAEDGVANASGDSLTFDFSSGTLLVCDMPSSQPYMPLHEEYTYVLSTLDLGGGDMVPHLALTKKNCDSSTMICEMQYDKTK
ncbi:MAG TPA: hypothetical protein VIF62_30460 [Labilithrix sp.]